MLREYKRNTIVQIQQYSGALKCKYMNTDINHGRPVTFFQIINLHVIHYRVFCLKQGFHVS